MPLKAMSREANITSQYARMPNRLLVSPASPPWRRKLSSPARSVSTLKLMARKALVTAKRAALAMSQPTNTTTSATSRRGMNAPT